jgi:hypothetical protein
MIKIESGRIDFDVDDFMNRLGVEQVVGHCAKSMDLPYDSYLIYNGVSYKYGSNVSLTAKCSEIAVEITFGSFEIQSFASELSIRERFIGEINNQSIFFSSGNGFLIVTINKYSDIENIETILSNCIELVPIVSKLLSSFKGFTPFAQQETGVVQ